MAGRAITQHLLDHGWRANSIVDGGMTRKMIYEE
jgi:hypothetical protein